MEQGAVGTVIPFADSGLLMTSLTVGEKSSLVGRAIKEFSRDIDHDFLLPLILRDRKATVPSGDTRIQAKDLIYIMAHKDAIETLTLKAGGISAGLKRIAIAGGSQIGRYVADYFLNGNNSMNTPNELR